MTNLLTRNSPRELTTPFPSKDEMHEIYEAALRAPDHAWLRPSRFIEVTGAGLDKLSNIFIEFAKNELKDVTPLQMEKSYGCNDQSLDKKFASRTDNSFSIKR